MAPYLTLPSLQRRMSFEQALCECHSPEEMGEFGCELDGHPGSTILKYGVDRYIQALDGYTRGEGLPDSRVSQSTYWLIDDHEFIGQIKRRHELNAYLTNYGGHIGYVIRPSRRHQGYGTRILALGLDQRKQEGIKQLLITCNEKNIGSRKIIETNGGVYISKIRSDEEQDMKLRYWVYL